MTNFDPALFLIAVGLMAAFAVAVRVAAARLVRAADRAWWMHKDAAPMTWKPRHRRPALVRQTPARPVERLPVEQPDAEPEAPRPVAPPVHEGATEDWSPEATVEAAIFAPIAADAALADVDSDIEERVIAAQKTEMDFEIELERFEAEFRAATETKIGPAETAKVAAKVGSHLDAFVAKHKIVITEFTMARWREEKAKAEAAAAAEATAQQWFERAGGDPQEFAHRVRAADIPTGEYPAVVPERRRRGKAVSAR